MRYLKESEYSSVVGGVKEGANGQSCTDPVSGPVGDKSTADQSSSASIK
jgi:hypothetical protein